MLPEKYHFLKRKWEKREEAKYKLFSVILEGNHLSCSVITCFPSRKNGRDTNNITLRIMLRAFSFHL